MSRFLLFSLLISGISLSVLSGCAERPASMTASSDGQTEVTKATGTQPVPAAAFDPSEYPVPEGMVWIPGGVFDMGAAESDKQARPDEGPVHTVELDGFYMDKTEVTNAQFLKFVEATGYVTLPELKPKLRSLKPGAPKIEVPKQGTYSLPGSVCLNPNLDIGKFDPALGAYNWWGYIAGANWRHPEGPGSSIEDCMDHPVVHVSWPDAQAYCKWAGKKLPTEAQWEYAARGGSAHQIYPWGNERNPDGKWLHNIWQGQFPLENTEKDGYRTTAPVASFPANKYGLYDMSGNVWEWVADYYRPDYYAESPRKNPPGPVDSLDPQEPHIIKRVQRGGSFACSDNYCISYRNSARMKAEEDTGAFHTGFRCVITPDMLQKQAAAKK